MAAKKIKYQKKILLLGFYLLANAPAVFSEEWAASGEYYDVNKYWKNDSNSCWAAAAANIIKHTGWNRKEHTSAQAIYDTILAENSSGSADTELDTAILIYDKQAYAFLVNPCNIKGCGKWQGAGIVRYIGDRLKAGWGVYLTIEHTSYGHALTVWKVILESDNKGKISVSDSDDKKGAAIFTLYDIEFKTNHWQIIQYGKDYLPASPNHFGASQQKYNAPHNARFLKIYILAPKPAQSPVQYERTISSYNR